VFAHHQHGAAFANGFRQEARVFRRDDRNFAKRWLRPDWAASEYVCELTEEPRPTQTRTSNDDTCTTGLVHHHESVVGRPDITIAKNGDIGHGFNQRSDRVPMGTA
jgi:hypothetical protein